MWIEITNDNKPEEGISVIGFNVLWIHEDFNPNGFRECYRRIHAYTGKDVWDMTKWCDDCEMWHCWCTEEEKDSDDTIYAPTHYMIPEPPSIVFDNLINKENGQHD